MTSRELFIQEIETFIGEGDIILPEAAMLYFESLKNAPSKEPKLITENGMKILKYAQENKDTYNNIFTGINREFKKHDGSTITVKGGTYGWWMNRPEETAELIAAIENKESGQRTPVYYSTAVQYGDNDIGDTYVEVDLTQQHLWVYENGVSVLDCDFVSGNVSKGHGTHTGVYGITYKERDATLQGQGYSSPVSYWMPFNENEGLHDASWRGSFGGTIYVNNGSHGCVNLPPAAAQQLFSIAYVGMPVVVHN